MRTAVIDRKVQNGFSNAALQYDWLTDLHKEIGKRLIRRIEGVENVLALLDIGMGTGWFTNRLTTIFPDATVVGLDFAPGMVSYAQKRNGSFKIVQADASCLPFKEGVFDIIMSNLAYQWVENLPQAFTFCRSRLNKRGSLYLTMFGRDTFHELFTVLDSCAGKKNNSNGFPIQRLIDQEQVRDALKTAGFSTSYVEMEHIKIHFPDMLNLIKWIKDIGANTLPKDIYIGRDLLLKANQYYNRHFSDSSGIYVTFEVIWAEARK